MIVDYLNTFSNGQTVAASGNATDTLDLGPLTHGNIERDIASGEPIYIVVSAMSGFTTGTLEVEVLTGSTTAAVTTVIGKSAVINCADIKNGNPLLIMPMPYGCKRYLTLKYTVTGASGDLYAGIVKDARYIKNTASGFEVK